MGNWSISIQGLGVHHNDSCPQDADKLVNKFMAELIAGGHIIESAHFTFGGRENLLADGNQAQLSHPCCKSTVGS